MAITLDGTAGITTPDLTDTSLTSGRVVYAGTSGNLTGSDNLTFSGTSLTLKTGYYEAYDPTDSTSAGVGMRFYTDGGGTKTENGRLTVAQTATSGSLSSMIFQTNSGTSLGEKMRLTGAGNLCVGSTSAGDAGTVTVSIGNPGTTAGGLQLWASSAQEHYIQWGDSSTGSATYAGAISYSHATNFMRFWTNSTERTRIDSSGQIFWGCTGVVPASMYFTPDANGGSLVSSSSTGTKYVFYFQYNNSTVGYIYNTSGGTTYNTTSDYRLKENIVPMTGALAKVAQLKPATYKWKHDGSDGQGFIAHELQEFFPDAVVGQKDDVDENGKIKPQGIDTSFLVATLTAAIQEQQAIIESLKARLDAANL